MFLFFLFFFLQKDIEKGCNYMSWIDGEMCGRSKQIIPGLLRKIHRYEGEIESLKQLIQKQEVELENLKKVLEEKEHYMELLVEELELKCDEVVMVGVKDDQLRKLQAFAKKEPTYFFFFLLKNNQYT